MISWKSTISMVEAEGKTFGYSGIDQQAARCSCGWLGTVFRAVTRFSVPIATNQKENTVYVCIRSRFPETMAAMGIWTNGRSNQLRETVSMIVL
jgi:hypothetical protein